MPWGTRRPINILGLMAHSMSMLRPLPGGVGRGLASRPVEIICGAIGVALLVLTVYAGLRATRPPPRTSRPRSSTWCSGSGWCRRASCSATCSARSTRGGRSGGRSRVARPAGGRAAPAAGVPGAARPLAGGRRAVRLHGAGAGHLDGTTRHGRHRRARRTPGHLHRDGAVRGGRLDRARRGVLGLLQPVRAPVRRRDARSRGRPAAAARRDARLQQVPGTVALWR